MEKKLPSRIKRKRNIKMKKSTLGIFVAFCAFAFSMFHVLAGENNTISIVSVDNATRGNDVIVKVNLTCHDEYNSAGVEIQFDKDVLEYKRTVLASVANPAASDDGLDDPEDPINFLAVAPKSQEEVDEANATGKITLGYAINGEVACEDIELAKVRFKVKDDAKGGESAVTISSAGMAKEVSGQKDTLTVDTEDGYVKVIVPVDPETVALEKSSYEIQKGSNDTLKVVYEPEDTSDDKTFTYVSSDSNIVSVDNTGKMTANAVGNATITVTAFGQELQANVTVVNHITDVTITGSKTELNKGEELQLNADVTPGDTSDDKTVTWDSSDTSVATVDSTGKVTAISGGQTVITAISTNNIVDTYTIDVVVPMIDFTTPELTVNLNKGTSKQLETTITPEDTTESKVIAWSSSNSNVATVSSTGLVTAIGGGEATITGSLSNGKTVEVTLKLE